MKHGMIHIQGLPCIVNLPSSSAPHTFEVYLSMLEPCESMILTPVKVAQDVFPMTTYIQKINTQGYHQTFLYATDRFTLTFSQVLDGLLIQAWGRL